MVNSLLTAYMGKFFHLSLTDQYLENLHFPGSLGIFLRHSLRRLNFVCGAASGLLQVPLVYSLKTRCDNYSKARKQYNIGENLKINQFFMQVFVVLQRFFWMILTA